MRLQDILDSSTSEHADKLQLSLGRVKEIAAEQWAPALPPHDHSHAGLPHTRSVERGLDKLLGPVLCDNCRLAKLTDVEAYVLLAAVQLHDIGRLQKAGDHGEESADLIEESGAELGLIPDQRLINCVASVCRHHNKDAAPCKKELAKFREDQTTVEAYGLIRVAALAAALVIADEMDESYRRSLPSYLKKSPVEEESAEGSPFRELCAGYLQRGRIRQLIASVEADPLGGCLTSVLDLSSDSVPGKEDFLELCTMFREGNLCVPLEGAGAFAKHQTQLDRLRMSLNNTWTLAEKAAEKSTTDAKEDPLRLLRTLSMWSLFKCVAHGKCLERCLTTARLLSILKEKHEKTEALGEYLRPLGLDYQAWFLDVGGVLIDYCARERREPRLSSIDVATVCKAMERLATGVFGRNEFSYDELRAEARIADLGVVKKIIHRAGLWHGDNDKSRQCTVMLGPDTWSLAKGKPGEVAMWM
ncbi:MAG: hypothetical protein HQ592_14070 [Planctomycetes bacterium]|nr:hypothetical protein [Planctomycetota bacterium]